MCAGVKKTSAAESLQLLTYQLNAFPHSAGGISTLNYCNAVGGVWKNIRYAMLRKLLVCARVLNESSLYVDVSLRLLDPQMSDLLSVDFAKKLFQDIKNISSNHLRPSAIESEKVDSSIPRGINK